MTVTDDQPVRVALALEQALSQQRLRPYLGASERGLADALRLYRWNAAVAAAFFEVLGAVEVTVRNAVGAALSDGCAGRAWWDAPWWDADPLRRADLSRAASRAAGQRDRHGAVLAHLPLGWWTDLLAPHHEADLWRPALRQAFPALPQGQGRADVHGPLRRLTALRNRIAHHEPVLGHDLPALHDDAVRVVSAVCPITGAWTARTSRVPALLDADPRTGRHALAAPVRGAGEQAPTGGRVVGAPTVAASVAAAGQALPA